ncbi:MAG TPA: ABC transporter substrate-binding protein, partial [Nitrospira sp.]|nr:ABC transporter substrate-binding protein [Nitrospira sp.]
MVYVVKRLALGLFLITLAIGVLLLSDWNRRSESRQAIPRIAILQHASQPVLDEGVHGIVLGLAEGGFKDGDTVAIQRFNAENDTPTENAIAREVTDGRFDLILTVSTLSLQAVAGANRAGHTKHVFGLVLDPFSAGVGISREDPLNHPKHLVGYGSMQPVAEAFRIAKQLLPSLNTVGVVWNPAEANSQASTRRAREASVQLGVRLLEATVDNSSGVAEAAGSLISRGAQALWVGGDVTVLVALDGVISAAKKAGIPVFTNIPPSAQRGALFDFGANHEEIGRLTGELAANILHGADPAAIP